MPDTGVNKKPARVKRVSTPRPARHPDRAQIPRLPQIQVRTDNGISSTFAPQSEHVLDVATQR
jgi:hypothetical protein